jgi:hypothetical protein
MDGACDTHVNERHKYHASVGNPEGKRALGRPVGRWRSNIKMVVTEVDWRCVDWINLTQDSEH